MSETPVPAEAVAEGNIVLPEGMSFDDGVDAEEVAEPELSAEGASELSDEQEFGTPDEKIGGGRDLTDNELIH